MSAIGEQHKNKMAEKKYLEKELGQLMEMTLRWEDELNALPTYE